MREYFMYGSVRGAPGNRRSYRDCSERLPVGSQVEGAFLTRTLLCTLNSHTLSVLNDPLRRS